MPRIVELLEGAYTHYVIEGKTLCDIPPQHVTYGPLTLVDCPDCRTALGLTRFV